MPLDRVSESRRRSRKRSLASGVLLESLSRVTSCDTRSPRRLTFHFCMLLTAPVVTGSFPLAGSARLSGGDNFLPPTPRCPFCLRHYSRHRQTVKMESRQREREREKQRCEKEPNGFNQSASKGRRVNSKTAEPSGSAMLTSLSLSRSPLCFLPFFPPCSPAPVSSSSDPANAS